MCAYVYVQTGATGGRSSAVTYTFFRASPSDFPRRGNDRGSFPRARPFILTPAENRLISRYRAMH